MGSKEHAFCETNRIGIGLISVGIACGSGCWDLWFGILNPVRFFGISRPPKREDKGPEGDFVRERCAPSRCLRYDGFPDSRWYGGLELSGLGECGVPAGQGGGPTSHRRAVPRLRGDRQFLLSSTGGSHDGKLGAHAGAATRVPLPGEGMAALHT